MRTRPTSRAGQLLRDFGGRPTPRTKPKAVREGRSANLPQSARISTTRLTQAEQCARQANAGAKMGKQRIIAETGAGQHGVATATVSALLGMECVVYMGTEDTRRRSRTCSGWSCWRDGEAGGRGREDTEGGHFAAIRTGSRTWRAPIRDRLGRRPARIRRSCAICSALIGDEARTQILEREGACPGA